MDNKAAVRAMSVTNNVTINTINPNLQVNQGLAKRHKIYLCQLSGLLNFIIKNHLKRTSYTSLNPQSACGVYMREVTGRMYLYGVIKLKLLMAIV